MMGIYTIDEAIDTLYLEEQVMYGSSRLGNVVIHEELTSSVPDPVIYTQARGKKRYELNNHLGNVLTTISDRRLLNCKASAYFADIINVSDYIPFGAPLADRTWTKVGNDGYRFGFNGQMKDDEVYGEGNSYSAENWQYDPRIGRRWNEDPITYPDQSCYVAFNNNPIYFADPFGLEGEPEEGNQSEQSYKRASGKFLGKGTKTCIDCGGSGTITISTNVAKNDPAISIQSPSTASSSGSNSSEPLSTPVPINPEAPSTNATPLGTLTTGHNKGGGFALIREIDNSFIVNKPGSPTGYFWKGAARPTIEELWTIGWKLLGGDKTAVPDIDGFGNYSASENEEITNRFIVSAGTSAFGMFGFMGRITSPAGGWVKRSVFKTLDPAIKKKVISAIENGIVAPTGKQGIIKLTATEAAATGYTHKIKILGKGGDIRIYGTQQPNGIIFFDKIMGH